MRLVIVVVVVLGIAGGWLWWSLHHAAPPQGWQGYADADFVKVAPVSAGQLTSVFVARGDEVATGAPLFAQDATEEQAARAQAAQQLAQAEHQLANLRTGGKPTEIEQAAANLADAQAGLNRARIDLERDEQLQRARVVSAQQLDQRRADYLSAKAKVEAATAALAQARAPLGRTPEIAAQLAAVEAAEAALAMAEWRLNQRRVAAPIGGRVADVLAHPGETMMAGAPVVSLLPPQNIFVRFFVAEPALGALHYGDPVVFLCDGCPADLAGTISFISPQAEFTPPLIYSETTKAKLVYRVEARPRSEQAPLINPGQPIEVRPKPDRAS
ncbi:MAG TPA: HlyD family efflux transporter periplasmic adaptor subunit [Stellaceae bacterium]|nr:HlyD family efflux transporter periplasmic adaptor subunit [Stellaceae bacterium]